MASVRRIIAGVLAALVAWTCATAAAQPSRAAETSRATVASESPVRIDGLDVEEVPQLGVGTQLNFSLFGTPDAVATLQIDGARHGLLLRESERGVYEGTYTIDDQDRITADGQVIATLRRGADVAKSVLDEPLVLGAAAPAAARSPDARGPDAQGPDLSGSRPEPRGPVARRSAVEPMPVPVVPARPSHTAPPVAVASACSDCAVVESVRAVETGGREGIGGAIAGGLLGAILGHQIGHGDLRGFARIVGAVGGALAGREIERASSRRVRYDVLLRLPNGSSQVHSYDSPPPLRVGDSVRLPAVTYARAPRFAAPY